MWLQAAFGACARIVVRDLRRTETTDIIMVYSGTMHCICAVVACITVPRSVVILQHTWQVVTLLLTGEQVTAHLGFVLMCVSVRACLRVAGLLAVCLVCHLSACLSVFASHIYRRSTVLLFRWQCSHSL